MIFTYSSAQVPDDSADSELTVGGVKFPYPYSDKPTVQKEEKKTMVKDEEKQNSVPEYRIVHRGHIDLQNFTHARFIANTVVLPNKTSEIDLQCFTFVFIFHFNDF